MVAATGKLGPLLRRAKRDRWDHMIRNSQDEAAVLAGCYYDARAAERVVLFFPTYLCHYEGEHAGKPFELLEWQKEEIIRPLYGWKREDGRRRFKIASIWLPKKNGKTALASGLSLYGLTGDGEEGPKVFSAARKREQAAYLFENCSQMCIASVKLRKNLEVIESRKRINFPRMNGYYTALSADSGSNEGLNASLLVLDELHAWSNGPGRRLFGALKYAGRARRQPLLIIISTAGDSFESLGYEQYDRAKRVKDEEEENIYLLPVIYELDPDADWTNEELWPKANPSLGATVQIDTIREEVQEAKNNPKAEADCLRYNFNIWVGKGGRFLPLEEWKRGDGMISLDELYELPCCGGLDLAECDDSAAWVLCFAGNGKFYLKTHFFLPEYKIEAKEELDDVPYRQWQKDGLYTLTPAGDEGKHAIDIQYIEERIERDVDRFDIRRICYDPWHAAELIENLELNIEKEVVKIEVPQNRKNMCEPTIAFRTSVLNNRMRHGGNPVLRWMSGNAIVDKDHAGNVMVSKCNSRGKVDGIVAAIMAYSQARQLHRDETESIYESEGLLL